MDRIDERAFFKVVFYRPDGKYGFGVSVKMEASGKMSTKQIRNRLSRLGFPQVNITYIGPL